MARNLGGAICLSKQNVRVKKSDHFVSEKKLACLPVPNESGRLLNPYSRAVVPQISKALGPLGHERVQFTLVGLFSRFTIIAASFSRADPGTKRRKKSLLQKQLKSSKPKPFQKESGRLLNVFLFIFLFPVLFLSLSLSLAVSLCSSSCSSISSSSCFSIYSSSSSSSSFSFSLSLSLSLSLMTLWIKILRVEKVTQSTCWTPLTTRYYKY